MFVFELGKLRTVHKKYIEEGKMTLEFFEKSERVIVKGTDVSANEGPQDMFVSVLISSASKENLELLIGKIVELKKGGERKREGSGKKEGRKEEGARSGRRGGTEGREEQERMEKLNRKELRAIAMNPSKNDKYKSLKKPPCFDFFDLPISLR